MYRYCPSLSIINQDLMVLLFQIPSHRHHTLKWLVSLEFSNNFGPQKRKRKKEKKRDTLRRIFERSRIINACYRPNQRSRSAPSCLRQTFPCVLWESSPCGPREPASSEAGSCWYDGRDLTAVDLNSIKDTALMKYSIFFYFVKFLIRIICILLYKGLIRC